MTTGRINQGTRVKSFPCDGRAAGAAEGARTARGRPCVCVCVRRAYKNILHNNIYIILKMTHYDGREKPRCATPAPPRSTRGARRSAAARLLLGALNVTGVPTRARDEDRTRSRASFLFS